MRTVAITNLDINVWKQKNEFPQVNYLLSLTEPVLKTQIPFELTNIGYDQI